MNAELEPGTIELVTTNDRGEARTSLAWPCVDIGVVDDEVVFRDGRGQADIQYVQAEIFERDGALQLLPHGWGHLRCTQLRERDLHELTRIGQGDEIGIAVKRPEQSWTYQVVLVAAHRPVISPDFEDAAAPFLDVLKHDPDDEGAREVYAAALEERGEHLRSSWLRAEALARHDPTPAHVSALREHTRRLEGAPRWRMLVSRARIEVAQRDETRPTSEGPTFTPCPRDGCPSRWHRLPAAEDERDAPILLRGRAALAAIAERTCRNCAATVTYVDCRALASPDTTSAIDRLAGRRSTDSRRSSRIDKRPIAR